jgi:membrane-associated phospholipid phosphatase
MKITRARQSPMRIELKSPLVWGLPLAAVVGFIVVLVAGENQPLFLAINSIGPRTSDLAWAHITVLGDGAIAYALCLALWRHRPDLVWALAITALLGSAWVHILKPLLALPRPPAVLGDAVHVIGPVLMANSFPSGHATTCFAVAGVLTLGFGARIWTFLLIVIAAVAATSRVVIGVHWPLDIFGGAFGGWIAAAISLELARRSLAFGLLPSVQWILGVLLAGCALALIFGFDTGYPQTAVFQRIVGAVCLIAAGIALWRDARLLRGEDATR